MMELTTSFTVAEPLERVWTALTDLRFVAECLPGAALTDVDADGTYHGTLAVRMGSINATFDGTARLEETDEHAHRVRLVAGGTSGLGDARLRLDGAATSVADGTRVTLDTEVELTGRLAQLGHGVGTRVTERLIQRLATTLERRLAGEEVEDGSDELSLLELVRAAVPEPLLGYARPLLVLVVATVVGWLLAGARPPARRQLTGAATGDARIIRRRTVQVSDAATSTATAQPSQARS
jgi:carbon monoxide dehydrogenase subunit G